MRISIVIPAYNSARFLPTAIDSALAQTYADCEIIVVNDGSTDETPTVLATYGDTIRVINQPNLGLAGARNSGIHAATGDLIGLLDADDRWLPTFCETLLQLAAQHPTAAAYYGAAQCMAADGAELPQVGGYKVIPSGRFYEHLLRANWLIPSTMLLRRDVIMAADLFDPAIRASEDWDLWLRIGKAQPFIGTDEIVTHYRLHEASLSADPTKMHRAVRQVVEKNFGAETDDLRIWTRNKRLAYGGLYRYCAITSLLRLADWNAAADHLRHALRCDPELSHDIDLFYEFALGEQPLGQRGQPPLDVVRVEQQMGRLLDQLRADSLLIAFHDSIRATITFALALAAYNSGQRRASRPHLWRTMIDAPQWRTRAAKMWVRSLL